MNARSNFDVKEVKLRIVQYVPAQHSVFIETGLTNVINIDYRQIWYTRFLHLQNSVTNVHPLNKRVELVRRDDFSKVFNNLINCVERTSI